MRARLFHLDLLTLKPTLGLNNLLLIILLEELLSRLKELPTTPHQTRMYPFGALVVAAVGETEAKEGKEVGEAKEGQAEKGAELATLLEIPHIALGPAAAVAAVAAAERGEAEALQGLLEVLEVMEMKGKEIFRLTPRLLYYAVYP